MRAEEGVWRSLEVGEEELLQRKLLPWIPLFLRRLNPGICWSGAARGDA